MKKLFFFALLLQNVFATNYVAYNVIGDVKFTIKSVAVMNPSFLPNGMQLALIKAYTSTRFPTYNNQNEVYFGVDLSTNAGKSLYDQFEKAYWYQQDIHVRCKSDGTINQPAPDAVMIPEPGDPFPLPESKTYRFWTPVITWFESE